MRGDPEAARVALPIATANPRLPSVANYLKAVIVMDASRDPIASRRFDDLLREAGIVPEAVTEERAKLLAPCIVISAAAAAIQPVKLRRLLR